jgi:eukaryotic-like serine/threonine-protein kinase
MVSGCYEIRGILGSGGMGQVFDAHDVFLNRRVAIKAARPSLNRELLRLEAQGIAAVRHPGVTQIYAFGEHNDTAYFVMERLLGITLDQHVETFHVEGALLPVPEAIDILTGVASALAAVHQAGIAHRDVKPVNVMLVVGERVVLSDFGVVAVEHAVEPHGPAVGTIEYMAPEIVTAAMYPGNAFLVDVYAFGVLAFEILAGRLPYQGRDARETLTLHAKSPVPWLADERGDVPPLLDGLVRELLAKDPYDRPSSMDSVVTRLRSPTIRSMTATRSTPPTGTPILVPPKVIRKKR